MTDGLLILDRDETQVGDERRRAAECFDKARLGRLPEGELVESEDLLNMPAVTGCSSPSSRTSGSGA
jgi:hypothetical protein